MSSNSIGKKLNTGNPFYRKAGFFVCAAAFVLVISSGGVFARQDLSEGASGLAAAGIEKTRAEAGENNKHKSGFIDKINRFVKSGGPVSPERHARLKNEIEKLRERITKRIERIDKKTLDLNSERARIVNLLSELETAAAAFDKIRIDPAAGAASKAVSEAGAHGHKTGEVEINKGANKDEKRDAKRDKKSRRGRNKN
jgi:hypothetical protein